MATTDLLSRHAGPIALAAGLLLAALDLGRLPIAAAADRAAALRDPLLVTVNAAYFFGFCALVLALVATLYPSFRASRVNPAEALRYE